MASPIQLCESMVRWLSNADLKKPHWSDQDWEQFQFACRVHGVAPLLHQKLCEVTWLDDSRRAWLESQYRFNAQRVARMQAELQAILVQFAGHDLAVMPLKGSVLTTTLYEDAGLRPMADLDVLIRPADVETATQLLGELGYEPDIAHWKHTEFSRPDNRRVVSTEAEHPDNPRKVELHLHCRETFGGPTVELTGLMWAQATQGDLLGAPAFRPHRAALWLHLLVHHTYHLWQGRARLVQLVDLARLTPQVGADCPKWLEKLDARYTYPSLALLQRYFPMAVDEALLAGQAARLSPSFRRWVAGLDLVNTSYLNPKPGGLYLLKALRFSQGHPREVAQALRFALLPSLEEITLDHPRLARSKAPWLAYFLLPLDWARRLGASGRR